MKLPIPVFTSSNVCTDVEIMKPKASVIADTRKILDIEKNAFSAIKLFISGSIESISTDDRTETDKMAIKSIISSMPYQSAEYIALQILILNDSDSDAIEGVYSCPRCGNKVITDYQKTDDYEIDTRDYISNLEVNYMETIDNEIRIELSEPVVIKNKSTDEIKYNIESIAIRYPTLSDCIVADKRFGSTDAVRAQFAMYVEAMRKINDEEIDKKFKNTYGMFIFENIKDVRTDLKQLNEAMSQYGIDTMIEKTCPSCNKIWKTEINVSNFFGSGLTL